MSWKEVLLPHLSGLFQFSQGYKIEGMTACGVEELNVVPSNEGSFVDESSSDAFPG